MLSRSIGGRCMLQQRPQDVNLTNGHLVPPPTSRLSRVFLLDLPPELLSGLSAASCAHTVCCPSLSPDLTYA